MLEAWSLRLDNVWQLLICSSVSNRADAQLLLQLAFVMAPTFLIHRQICCVFGVPLRLRCALEDVFVVDSIWHEIVLILALFTSNISDSLFSSPQAFPANSQNLASTCYCWVLPSRAIACLTNAVRCQFSFLCFAQENKSVSRVWVTGMKICVAACFPARWHVLGRKAGCLFQRALLWVQTAGSSQREASAVLQHLCRKC